MKRKLTVLLIILSLVMSAGCAKKEQTTPTKDEPTAEATQPSNDATGPSQESTEPSENMTQPTDEEPEPTQEEQQTQKPTKGELGYDPTPMPFPEVTREMYGIAKYDSVTEAFAEYVNEVTFDLDEDKYAIEKINQLWFDNPPAVTQFALAISKEHNFGILFEYIYYDYGDGGHIYGYFYSQIYAFGNLIDVSDVCEISGRYDYLVYGNDTIKIQTCIIDRIVDRYTITENTIKYYEEQSIWSEE